MARNFNGTNQIGTTGVAASSFVAAGAGTLAGWFRPTGSSPAVASAYQGRCLIGDEGGFLGLFQATVGGNDRIYAYNYNGGEQIVGMTYTGSEWVHVAWVHSGGNLYIYKNGSLVSSVASGNTDDLTNAIAVALTGPSQRFAGDMCEIAAWNVALSAAEIASLATGRRPSKFQASSLKGYWKFDGSGTPELDSSGNARDMTLTNSPAVASNPAGVPKSGLSSQMAAPGAW